MNALVPLPASRRAILGAVLATMAARPALAFAVADPVYGAMARHRVAYDECMEGWARPNGGRDIDDEPSREAALVRRPERRGGNLPHSAHDHADNQGGSHRLRPASR